jgi:uncharacterized membrane protein
MDAGQLQSKQPRSALAGSYGHPVHPILVTLPIGAWLCSFIFDLCPTVARSREPGALARCG